MMKASDALQWNRQVLATCIPEESIVAFAARLNSLHIGAMPVVDAQGALVGILSERDIVRAFARDGARLVERRVRDLMVREVVTCGPNASMSEAEKLMDKHHIRHLPVVDGAKVVGMLSVRDVMAWRLRDSRDEVKVLREAMIATRHV
jgi:CBS domain-containing protein